MGGDTVDKEGSDREQTKQRRALMCFVPPLTKKLERHHQMMATMEPNKCGEVIAAPSSQGRGANRDGGECSGGGRKQQGANQSDKGIDVFCFPFRKKIGASSSDNGKDRAKRMRRGKCHPSSQGVGANCNGGRYSG
jgi:hypothetical protein